jgi:2-amino-4-hydroxy-6-hydroxymethyldihydropteridine diphosphokinase
MGFQHNVVLAIGSNQGDRLANVTKAISAIHLQIGTVVKMSGLYETPSWGFEGDAFYNCAVLVHTSSVAQTVLDKALAIEIELGRMRQNAAGYQSRSIDIDVIAFDEDIVNTATLQVPHPLLQDRLFVLLPMRDLKTNWQHPVLHRSVTELIGICQDHSVCKLIGKLEIPLVGFHQGNLNHIVIEGNIGAGKTTLATRIAEDFNAKTVLERFADNPFLPKFYEDPDRYAFSLEMSFLADRYQQVSDDLARFDLRREFVIADYSISKSLIFARITLTADEFRVYKKLFGLLYKEVPKPDAYIYLYQRTERLLENIRKRGRDYEQQIAIDYLDKISLGYLEQMKTLTGVKIISIDISERDFVANQADYISILDEIQHKMSI